MRTLFFLIPLLAGPVAADETKISEGALSTALLAERLQVAKKLPASEIKFVDAKSLTVEQLQALAAKERANPTDFSCCDWGGGCFPHNPGS